MERTEQLINFGEAYIDAISKLKEDLSKDVANILSMFNCIHPDNGYRLGFYIEEPSPECAVTHITAVSGGLYYTNRKLIFKHNQLENLGGWTIFKRPKIENITEDLAPSVMIDGNNCVVTCCFWNDWEGLIREELHLSFNDNGRVKIGNF